MQTYKYKSALLVDDNFIDNMINQKILNNSDFAESIVVKQSCEAAINYLQELVSNNQELPEIIFLDLSMPIMNGWQFLEEYTKLNPYIGKKISIYICSSSISQDDITRAKAINEVTDYIIKPIAKTKLIDLIKNL